MLAKEITDLLWIDYKGLFDDHSHCFQILEAKRASGDPDTPVDLTKGVLFDLSPDLFIWVTEQHIENNSAHLVAQDVMSNIATAGLTGVYGDIVEMLAQAGHVDRAAQIWRADVASHMDVVREFDRAKKAVDRFEALPEAKRKKAPDRYQRDMARKHPAKVQVARYALAAFEAWTARYGIAGRHADQIAAWTAEVQGTAKPKLPAPDKTPMSEPLLWDLIAQAQAGSESETILRLEDLMAAYTPKAIRDAAKQVQTYLTEAYRDEVWALAYLVQNGCSDDAFDDFRAWIILKGQHMFGRVLTAPDDIDPADFAGADFGAAGSLMSAFENAYVTRSGKPLILPKMKTPRRIPNEDGFAALLPNLTARLAGKAA